MIFTCYTHKLSKLIFKFYLISLIKVKKKKDKYKKSINQLPLIKRLIQILCGHISFIKKSCFYFKYLKNIINHINGYNIENKNEIVILLTKAFSIINEIKFITKKRKRN